MDVEFIRTKVRRKEYVIDPDHLVMLRKYGITQGKRENEWDLSRMS